MGRRCYSQSEVKTFLKCGKMWEFRYVLGIKTPPTAALTVGCSVDEAVSSNLHQKIFSGEDLPEEEVLDRFSDDFERRSDETEWQDSVPGQQKDIGARLVRLHHSRVAPSIEPESVQESFTIGTDAGYDLTGTMDLTEKDGTIADTKTSRTAYGPDAVTSSLQPAIYDFAYEAARRRRARKFRYDVLIKPSRTRAPRLQQVEGRVTAADRRWLFSTIDQVHRAIIAGVTLPAPEGSWYCSPKWCGYWNRCKGRKQ